MADLASLQTALINADKAGDSEAATVLAGEIKRMGMGTVPPAARGYTGADVLGPHESALKAATSMVSTPLSGFAGIAGAVLPGPQGQGSNWVGKVQDALTYEPRTK